MDRAEVFLAQDRSRNSRVGLRGSVVESLAVFLSFAIALTTVPIPSLFAADKKEPKPVSGAAGPTLTEDQKIFHLLNRLGYGPRPSDLERVRRMGIEKYVEQQLHPETISDTAVEAKLADLATLRMSTGELLAAYPPPNQEQGKRLQEMREAKEMEAQLEKDAGVAYPAPGGANTREDMPMRREAREGMMNGPRRVIGELAQAKLLRAVYSERQLHELTVDFWENHFNVFAGKGADRWLVTSYDRDVIRPHALGNFKDLLVATAKSPAMLFYLDNWMSTRADFKPEEPAAAGRRRPGRFGRTFPLPRPQQQQNVRHGPRLNRGGLNENYARELMELHTLGVNGGYTQQDVGEVARCFTGWTIRAPRREAEFYFHERMHDPGVKHVLGQKIHEGGMKDGLKVLDILAHHPSTAKFISTKLARRFVSDDPPPALVERMAKTFQKTEGDIRKVLETMFLSPEFWSPESHRAKIKRPLELVASSVRAVGADITNDAPGLLFWIARMGEPLFLCQPPTGYSDLSSTWVNTGALLERMNFATALVAGRIRGAKVSLDPLIQDTDLTDPENVIERGIHLFLGNDASPTTRNTLEQHASDPEIVFARLDDPRGAVNVAAIFGLVLGAPEFQRK